MILSMYGWRHDCGQPAKKPRGSPLRRPLAAAGSLRCIVGDCHDRDGGCAASGGGLGILRPRSPSSPSTPPHGRQVGRGLWSAVQMVESARSYGVVGSHSDAFGSQRTDLGCLRPRHGHPGRPSSALSWDSVSRYRVARVRSASLARVYVGARCTSLGTYQAFCDSLNHPNPSSALGPNVATPSSQVPRPLRGRRGWRVNHDPSHATARAVSVLRADATVPSATFVTGNARTLVFFTPQAAGRQSFDLALVSLPGRSTTETWHR